MEGLLTDLSYSPGIGPRLVKEVERQARRFGLPLSTLELLGQDAKVARDFVRAARRGRAREFVDLLDATALERALTARELGVRRASPLGVFLGL